MKKYAMTMSLLALSLVLFACQPKAIESTKTPEAQTVQELKGQSLPGFAMADSAGKTILSSDLADKPTLLMVWASWCPHCQEQLPIIQELYEQYGATVDFILLNATGGHGETAETAKAYMVAKGYSLPWYTDDDLAAVDKLLVDTIPTIFLVDKDHVIKQVFTENQTKETLQEALETLIAK